MTCLCLVPLLLDEDHLQLCERLVPRLRQGDQGEDGADEQEGGVQQEDPLHPHQAGQVGECLEGEARMWKCELPTFGMRNFLLFRGI